MTKLSEVKALAAAGVGRLALSKVEAHAVLKEHIQSGGKFRDHQVAMAVMRAFYVHDANTDPTLLIKAENKLFEILGSHSFDGLVIERA